MGVRMGDGCTNATGGSVSDVLLKREGRKRTRIDTFNFLESTDLQDRHMYFWFMVFEFWVWRKVFEFAQRGEGFRYGIVEFELVFLRMEGHSSQF